MARSLWICPRRAGPAAEERQGRDKEDKGTGRPTGKKGGGRGELRGGASPAGALAHVPCCHTKGDPIRVGLKDGGKRERAPLFFFFPFSPSPPVRAARGGGKT